MHHIHISATTREREPRFAPKITLARVNDIIRDAGLDLEHARPHDLVLAEWPQAHVHVQGFPAWIDYVRWRWVIGTAIQDAYQNRNREERRRIVEAVTTLRRDLPRWINPLQRDDASEDRGGELLQGIMVMGFRRIAAGRSVADRAVTARSKKVRALLRLLDWVRELEPPVQFETPWYDAAIHLAAICLLNGLVDSLYNRPLVRFVRATLIEIGALTPADEDLERERIRQVLRRPWSLDPPVAKFPRR